MSLTARRSASWLLVLSLLMAAMIGWQFVPGARGLAGEVRWLIRHPSVAKSINRAGQLLRVSRSDGDPARYHACMQLLFDADQSVRRIALQLLAEQLMQKSPSDGDIEHLFNY